MRLSARAFTRFGILPVVALLGVMTLGSADTEARYNAVGHKLMCACGCSQVLLECNHLGCPNLAQETAELKAAIAHGDSDNTILASFQSEYGPTVLAAPWLTRFNYLAWIVPPALLILGLAGTIALVRKWRLRTVPMPAVGDDPVSNELRKRIRQETEL